MKLKSLVVLVCLLAAAASPCFAEMVFSILSKEEAKKMGMEVRTTANGPNEVWVELEFKAEGALKSFDHVSLEIRASEKFLLGYSALKEKRTPTSSVTVGFLANRAYLDNVALMIVVGQPMDYSGYELQLKDFIESAPAALAKTNAAAQSNAAAAGWEYKQMSGIQSDETLNKMSAEGWSVVSVTGVDLNRLYLLKRAKH